MVSRNANSNTSSSSNANYNVNANANAYVSASASSSASADLSQARVIEPAHFKSGESSQQKNAEAPQGDCCLIPSPSAPFDRTRNRGSNTVFKSGFLFISSKGLGWTSWKKRWFILTRTSLVFFRSDPSALPQKGGEVNLTLGGIDLNNSGSVVVRADKKLLTVLFPNGGDGRGFTLKAETSEDLYEWKAALENALAQAPSAALVMGQNGIFRNDAAENVEGNVEQWRERRPVKSLVVGRPILLALEDIDGSPSFLEKALRFMEQHGVKVEGILRQAADVEEVELRVQQYEQGKTEFSPDEDAHVVGDCVKHVLRELPSSPVPASCCTALLEAYLGNDRDNRVNAIRDAIAETFPEPNRRLLQRILKMMHVVASHKAENRMTTSAVAACMAPLLLRPLLAGDCELEDDFDHHGDGSAQLLAAAAAANHAHAIVTILLEEYHRIFAEEYLQKDSLSPDEYSESEGSETEELTEEDEEISETADDPQNDDDDLEDDQDRALSGTLSESSGHAGSDLYDYKVFEGMDSDVEAKHRNEVAEINQRKDKESQVALDHATHNSNGCSPIQSDKLTGVFVSDSHGSWSDLPSESPKISSSDINSISCLTKASSKSSGSAPSAPSIKRPTVWGRTPARKNLSMESVDSSSEDELVIQRLEITKNDLQNKIAKEVKGNAILQASLERRKQALHERRQALEQDVARLQEQLQRERDLRATLEAGLNMPPGNYAISSNIDNKARAELEEIALAEADVMNLKQTVADLHLQLNQQRQHGLASVCESCTQHQHSQSQELPRDSTRTQGGAPALSKQAPVKQRPESTNVTDNKPTSASRNLAPDSPYHDRPASIRQPVQEKGSVSTSSQLVELTSHLDFLKERRSHLLSELHNLDANYTGGSQSQMRLPPSKYHSQ